MQPAGKLSNFRSAFLPVGAFSILAVILPVAAADVSGLFQQARELMQREQFDPNQKQAREALAKLKK